MRKCQCLLFVLKRTYICYYVICMTVPLIVDFECGLVSHHIQNNQRRCSEKKVFPKNLAKFAGKHLRWSLFFCNSIKKETQVFYCEFCEIFKNSFFTQHIRGNASAYRNPAIDLQCKSMDWFL